MTEFNKNNPLGVASEGLLQNDTPISVASSGLLKEKVADIIGSAHVYIYVASDITFDLSHVAISTPITVQALSVCEYVSATQSEERGGKSLYRRKRQAQTHIYVWDVPPQAGDPLTVEVSAECSFIAAPIIEEVVVEIPIIVPVLNVHDYDGCVNVKVGIDSRYDFSRSTINIDDEMLVLLFDDLFEDDYVVTMTVDLHGDRRKKEDDALLTLMEVI